MGRLIAKQSVLIGYNSNKSNRKGAAKVVTRENVLERVKNMVLELVAEMPVMVYLYGSWARGEEKRTSDIDIAIGSKNMLPTGTLPPASEFLPQCGC